MATGQAKNRQVEFLVCYSTAVAIWIQFGAAQDCGEIFLAMAFGHYMASIPNLKDAFHIIIRNDSSEQGREPSQNM